MVGAKRIERLSEGDEIARNGVGSPDGLTDRRSAARWFPVHPQ